jgi:hypothetical protein
VPLAASLRRGADRRGAVGGLRPPWRMFLLEKENVRLKKIVANLELDKSILKEALEGKY